MLKGEVDFMPQTPREAVEWVWWFVNNVWGDVEGVEIERNEEMIRVVNKDCDLVVGILHGRFKIQIEKKYKLDGLDRLVSDLTSALSSTPSKRT